MNGERRRRARPRKAPKTNRKSSPPVVGGEGGSGRRPPRSVVMQKEPVEAGEAPPPSGRQRCAEAGLVPRAVVMNDTGAVGVVLEVSDNGEIEVAFTRGRQRTCTLADMLEVLAGPREWHAGRAVVLEQWQERNADWTHAHDEQTRQLMMAAWCMMGELAERMGFVLGQDLVVHFMATRPRVRVPSILRLTGGEAWQAPDEPPPWRVPYRPEPWIHPPVVEDGRRGVVSFELEGEHEGPAWLLRDGQAERLFFGAWVTREQARAYAATYGHELDR